MIRRLDVDVTAQFTSGGRVEPKAVFLYKTGQWYPVVDILRVDRAANLKVGGQGVRYRCHTLENAAEGTPVKRLRTLWREGDRWFVEEEVGDER